MFTRLLRWDKDRPEDDIYTMARKEFDHIYDILSDTDKAVKIKGKVPQDVISQATSNTYNIHLSTLVQHYYDGESSPLDAKDSGYWTYLTKEMVSTIDEIKTPIFFRDILGVKVSATTTLGNNDKYMFAGVMDLVSQIPTTQIINWNNGVIRHAITYQNKTIWNTSTPWHFMYKMEFCNISNNSETVVFTRLYKLSVDLPQEHIKAIQRLYDESDPPQPYYNLITMLELIINVKI